MTRYALTISHRSPIDDNQMHEVALQINDTELILKTIDGEDARKLAKSLDYFFRNCEPSKGHFKKSQVRDSNEYAGVLVGTIIHAASFLIMHLRETPKAALDTIRQIEPLINLTREITGELEPPNMTDSPRPKNLRQAIDGIWFGWLLYNRTELSTDDYIKPDEWLLQSGLTNSDREWCAEYLKFKKYAMSVDNSK